MKLLCTFLTVFLISYTAFSQIKVGDNVGTISPASVLEIESTDQGVLLPRLTSAQRDAQGSWTEGHIIYNTSDSCFQFFDGNIWDCLVGESTQPSDPTSSFPFTILATTADCKISDYITEGAPDTMIIQDKTETPTTHVNARYHYYQYQAMEAAMNNHSIVGFQTDTRTADGFAGSQARIYYALPDANKHIGKSFLLYTTPDPFFSLTSPGAVLQQYLIGEIPATQPVVDRPEDWANDFISFQSRINDLNYNTRYKLYGPAPNSNVEWDGYMLSNGFTDPSELEIYESLFIIITSLGPNDWKVNCRGTFTYKNPLVP